MLDYITKIIKSAYQRMIGYEPEETHVLEEGKISLEKLLAKTRFRQNVRAVHLVNLAEIDKRRLDYQ